MSATTHYINRIRPGAAEEHPRFTELKSESISLLQELSGSLWTDYNTHDPGVTILEQSLYALTELIHRTTFKLEDLLSDNLNELNYQKLGLHQPEIVLSSRATTLADFEKLILDAFPNLENVWFEANDLGQYTVYLKIASHLLGQPTQQLINEVKSLYSSNRNFCEDLRDVTIVEPDEYNLNGEIELTNERNASDVLADIIFHCNQALSETPFIQHFHDAKKAGQSLEQMFDGPFTQHGLIDKTSSIKTGRFHLVSAFYPIINNIPGVKLISSLYFEKNGAKFPDHLENTDSHKVFSIALPMDTKNNTPVLTVGNRSQLINIEQFNSRYQELIYKRFSLRSMKQDLALIYQLPKGGRLPRTQFTSIQSQFPPIYGIGKIGVPNSASAADKAKSNQLAGYILLLEQQMANYVESLNNLAAIFSVDTTHKKTYFSSLISSSDIPNVNDIYMDNAINELKNITDQFDDFLLKKNRIFDYLLALHGEHFDDEVTQNFNTYYATQPTLAATLQNKLNFLKNVIETGRDRNAGADYLKSSWRAAAHTGLQRRISTLLGFKHQHARSLTMAILKQGLKLIPDSRFNHHAQEDHDIHILDLDRIQHNGFHPCIPIILNKKQRNEFLDSVHKLLPFKHHVVSESVFRDSVTLDNFLIGRLKDENYYQLVLASTSDCFFYLGEFKDKQSANVAANLVHQYLRDLNMDSEGLHVIEHILLLPHNLSKSQDYDSDITDTYFHRASVIFPAWTANCINPEFRRLAEEKVHENAAAHALCEVFWLNFQKMFEFELLYVRWMKYKSQLSPNVQKLDQHAQAVTDFLVSLREDK